MPARSSLRFDLLTAKSAFFLVKQIGRIAFSTRV
jgi:hypothetical protein